MGDWQAEDHIGGIGTGPRFESMTIEQWLERKAERDGLSAEQLAAQKTALRRADLADDSTPGVLGDWARATVPIAHQPSGAQIGEASWPVSTPLVQVADVHMPEQVDVVFYGGKDQPRLQLTVEVRSGVPAFTKVELIAKPDGRPVIPRDLQLAKDSLNMWLDVIMAGVSQRPASDEQAGTSVPDWADSATARKSVTRARRKAGRSKTTPEFLARVAEVYRANVAGEPVRAVATAFQKSHRQAARYVELCRTDEYQLLPKTTPGQRKA